MITNRKTSKNDIGHYTANGFVETGKRINSHPQGNCSGVIVIVLLTLAILAILAPYALP